MKYKIEDLDYIFIRAKNKDEKWDSLSLNEITDDQWSEWIESKFGVPVVDDENAKGQPWTKEQKADFLTEMSKRVGGEPVVCMVKREAR